MSPLFDFSEPDEEYDDDGILPYEEMDDDEFFEHLAEENAEAVGVSADELDEMGITEIEDRLGIESKQPHHPKGSREGYLDTDRLDVVSEEEYEKRRSRVRELLGI